MGKRPNVLIFNPDQFRADALGHLGNPAAITPNLDRICKNDGVSFRYAFCQSPLCTPSRCSFMSGWYPHVRGHRSQTYMMRQDDPVLLKTLKDKGYFVWWGGKNDLVPGQNSYKPYCNIKHTPEKDLEPLFGDYRKRMGTIDQDTYYSFYVGEIDKGEEEIYYDSDWDNVMSAIDFIRNRPEDQPFCIYLPLIYPHPPYAVEEPWYSLIDRNKVPSRIPAPENWDNKPSKLKGFYELQGMKNWSEERWKEIRATYYGMCSRIDHQFGLLLQALKEENIYDDTAVFVFSDHGDFTGDYGLPEKNNNTFEDALVRVPFIIKPPANIPVKARISDALVELIDFPATVECLLNIKPEHKHFGRSLMDVIAGKTDSVRDAVFSEGGWLKGENEFLELSSYEDSLKNYKLKTLEEDIYWPYFKMNLSNGPESTKAVMVRTNDYKYVRRLYESDELYDLRNDPGETMNRINDSSLSEVLMMMKERLLTFYLETGDVVPYEEDKRDFDKQKML